ncbi:MAG: dynamin family protein [Verrucomicrobiaceae bacterium]|nr:dynamin family protein [Verrucomicrobiaceae bacterium]
MIGDDYFQLRTSLSNDLIALRALVHELGAEKESIIILDNLLASLKEPFVFVVVGEVNVGKSTFLNALFGQDFSRTGVIPTTDKILFFKHGDTLHTTAITPTLDEVSIPIDFLKDFHIVDTPGTNSIENEHQQITERFVPIADLVIFVFSAMNPWGASAWQFLEKVHRQWMRNVIFVLQQSDVRSPEELLVITDYMAQLTRQRFGRDFPIFPVSAKKAYMARSSGIDRDKLMLDSGFPPLEKHISSSVTQNATRQTKLLNTLRMALQTHAQYRERVQAALDAAKGKSAMLQELATERQLQAGRTLKKISPALDATEREYHESAVRVAGMADQALSTRRAFGKSGEEDEDQPNDAATIGPKSLDHRLFQELQQFNTPRWNQVGVILEEDYTQYSRFLRSLGKDTLFLASDTSAAEAEYEQDLPRRFTSRIDSTIRRFVIGLKLDESIEPGLKRAQGRARLVPWLIAPTLAAIGAGYFFEGPLTASLALIAGLLIIGFFFMLTKATLSATRHQLIDKLDESAGTLRTMLGEQITDDVEAAFNRFLNILNPAQEEVEQRIKLLSGQMKKLTDLEASLRGLEQHLKPAQHSS